MTYAHELGRLCESWWKRGAESSADARYELAEQFLALLGWEDADPVALPASAIELNTVSYLLAEPTHGAVTCHFLMPGILAPPSAVVEQGLDFCGATRALLDASRPLKCRYVFVCDFFRSYLYDVHTEELLLHADTPDDFQREFGTVLCCCEMREGSLAEVRRQPRSYLARQVREWCQRWSKRLVAESAQPEEATIVALDRLVLLRYLVELDALKTAGWSLRNRFRDLAATAAVPTGVGCGKALVGLFDELHVGWNAALFARMPYIDVVLERDDLAKPLITELTAMARTKFSIPTILESFNYGDAAEKARVRMIPEDDEERKTYLAKQVVSGIDDAAIEVDVADEGYRAVCHWFDRLVELYERLAREFECVAKPAAPSQEDMDLLTWSERDSERPVALTDPPRHALEHGLVVYCASPRQRRTARLVLYLHLADHLRRNKTRLTAFPRIENALHDRPSVLESDRRQIFQANPSAWDVV